MIVIIYFLYFIAGICFIQFVLPIGDSIVSLIATYIEMLKSKINIQISKNNEQIMKNQNACETSVSHAIGFQLPIEEEEDYE